MDIQKYDPKTKELIEKVLDQKRNFSEDVFKSLSKLMTVARKNNDYTLQGFVHFHKADALLAFEKSYLDFRKNLARSIYFFQLGGEEELLARAYNYVAADANNNGSFDVAYLYLMNAARTCENLDNDYLMSMINNNIGQAYARMHNHKKALKYVRLGNRLQERCPKDDYYFHQNMINGYFSEGMLCCLLHDLAGAERANRKIARLEKEADLSDAANLFIPMSLLRLMIAVLKKDEALCRECSREVIEKMRGAHRIYDFITDIDDVCRVLIEQNHMETVREMLDIIAETVEASEVTEMKWIVASLEVAYYDKLGDTEKLMECLRDQYRLSEQQQTEQNRIYQYSIDLINIMEEQRKEQEKVRLENESLQSQVQTDPLTDIPNRLMLDRSIPLLYKNALEKGHPFGVDLMDINKFKEYNDTYGHLAGDYCLQQVAKAIQAVADRPDVYCARYGGDEFIMLFENKTDEEIRCIAEELNAKIHDLNIAHSSMGKEGRISVSQGICNAIPQKGFRQEDYLNEADNALYAVKKKLDLPGKTELIRMVHLAD